MEIGGKVAVVTGAGGGIGSALCRAFRDAGAAAVVVSDLDGEAAERVAAEVGGTAVRADVGTAEGVRGLVEAARAAHGRIDLFCCNAGIAMEGGVELPDEQWDRIWRINFMQHVWAVRATIDEMLERGSGGYLMTASAAGLLTQIGSAPYAVTKHADVALAEWLSVTYGARGVEVFCLCPQGVRTQMLEQFERESAIGAYLAEVAVDADAVARSVLEAMAAGRFLVLPHPEVEEYLQRKAGDYDRWLGGMRKMQARMES